MDIFARRGIPTIINAAGTLTRLSGSIMRPEVSAAMAEASRLCVDMAELQAHASAIIASNTGAEAGLVTSGASAGLLLAAAACIAGLDPSRMNRLPDTAGFPAEIIVPRSHRNGYDHALRAARARLVEVGLPDRHSGAGGRDTEPHEIGAAITPETAAIFYVVHDGAQPPLSEVVALARAKGIQSSSMPRRSCRPSRTCAMSSPKALISWFIQAERRLAGRNLRAFCAAAAISSCPPRCKCSIWT
jgi:D-glucosaminate-6-phosphate ammonia-lyase